jgi:hypothetical protein
MQKTFVLSLMVSFALLFTAACDDASTLSEQDLCSINPCLNGGICVALDGQESCECQAGYTGTTCDLATALPCDPNPCLNQGVCSATPDDGYSCACAQGYTGPNCEVAPPSPDACDPDPCLNGGTCIDNEGDASCICAAGYEGDFCESEIVEPTPCDPNPCQNGGTCVPGQDEAYSCICAPGYEGDNCETTGTDPCEPNPCLNGGACSEDGAGGFDCVCVEGFEGDLCGSQVSNACTPNPCQNGGTCLPDGEQFSCVCPAGFEGDLCEVQVQGNPCEPNPCENGGTCAVLGDNVECTCVGGFSGAYCEIPPQGNTCEPNPCLNGGMCMEDAAGNATCQCVAGFTGIYCDVPPAGDACEPNPCENEGTCSLSGGFACQGAETCDDVTCQTAVCLLDDFCCDDWDSNCANCAAGQPGFLGLDCSSVGDACVTDKAYDCACPEGFTGANCEVEDVIPPAACEPDPCLNGGVCSDMGDGTPVCACVEGYTGELCEEPPVMNPCEDVTCENGGLCKVQDGVGLCVCPPGFEGLNCEIPTSGCEPNPCLNGGVCTDGPEGALCACVDGYTGDACEFAPAVDPCSPNPCENDGMCNDESIAACQDMTCDVVACVDAVCALDAFCCNNWDGSCADCAAGEPGIGGIDCSGAVGACSEPAYSCTCLEGFEGDNCEVGTDPCVPNPCQNDGVCSAMGDGYLCACPDGFTGSNCETMIDGCSPNPCQNGGVCTDDIFGVTCACVNGYTGSVCEVPPPGQGCEPNPCLNNGTCTEGEGALCQGAECDDVVCAEAVCALDAFCCAGWDNFCAACAAGGPGYGGLDCTSATDSCLGGEGAASCACAEGFEGDFCETNIDDCAGQACLNGGLCVDGIASYACQCEGGYTGPNCEFPPVGGGEVCEPNPCADGEICSEVQGPLCQGDSCDDLLCQNAVGELDDWCLDNWDSFCAQCAAGGETWLGDDCSGVVVVCTGAAALCEPDGNGGPDGSCDGWVWNGACWYTAPAVGMSCDEVCSDKGGFDILGSQHNTNDVGMHFYPDKVSGGSDWSAVECSSTDNDTNWPANGEIPEGTWSHESCHVNCACLQ